MPTDQLRGFQDFRPLHQQQPLNKPYFSQPSSPSAVSSVFASGQGQGFSGHQLRINHFTSGVTEDYIMEVNINNPIYDIGPSLPQECQEPWAALIDTGALASIAPQSFVPHIPIKKKSETLTNVNGGDIKVLGIKHVTFITGKVITHVNFLIVEDVKIQSLVLMQFITIIFRVVFMEKGSASFNNIITRHFFTIIKVITMHQV